MTRRTTRPAGELKDVDLGRDVTVGAVRGRVEGIQGGPGELVTLQLDVGGLRAWFQLRSDYIVEVHT